MRTLVISPNWIGDAVMAQPLLQLLQQQSPQQPIDVLAPTWVAPVWRAMREVDTVLESPFKHGMLQLRDRRAFAKMLQQRGYGKAYILPNTLKFALIPWLARIPQRIGYRGEMRYGLLNVMHRDDRLVPRPMVSFYAALAAQPAASAQLLSDLPRPTLSVTDLQIQQTMKRVGLQLDRPVLVFAPGAEFGSAKRWPIGHFARLAKTIHQNYPDTQIVLLGSAKDQPVCDQIAALAPTVLSLAGVTTLDEAIALIARADAMVSNDSGLLHIASALNRPVVAIYGPTDPDHAPPFSDVATALSLRLDCAPCRQRECPLRHHNCMQKLIPDMVWTPLQAILTK
ncbi:MAG: lipopolysaccharide heptosyltransferase II [Burkholderiaceae bacterium]